MTHHNSRRNILATIGSVGTVALAGCGSNADQQQSESVDDSDDTNTTDEENSPTLEGATAVLDIKETSLIDLTEQDTHQVGISVTIEEQYDDGSVETTNLDSSQYEVIEAYTKRSNGGNFYGNLIYEPGKQAPDTAEQIAFEDEGPYGDEGLRALGFYNEPEVESGQIILDPGTILAGQNELGLTVQLEQDILEQYSDLQAQEITQQDQIQARKTDEETKEDYIPARDNSIEIWQKWRRITADERLDRGAVNSDEFETWHDVEETVLENVSTSPSNSQKYLEQASGEFAVQARLAGEFPSKVNNYFQDIVMRDSESMVVFDMPSQGEDLSGVYVWNENESDGVLFGIASKREGSDNPPKESGSFARGTLARQTSPLLNPEAFPEWARVTVETIHEIGNGLRENSVSTDYAVSVMDNLAEDKDSFPILMDNIQTALANLYAPGTTDAFTLTGEDTDTEIEADFDKINGQPSLSGDD